MIRWVRRLILLEVAVFVLTVIAVVVTASRMQDWYGPGRGPAQPVDAAIVLAAGIDPDGVLTYSTRRRVAAGVRLLTDGRARRLILSGGIVEAPGPSAAGLMRARAISLGAPPGALLIEDRSRTTFENIRFSFAVAKRAGLHRLAIVTDHYHLARAAMLARYFGRPEIALVATAGLEKQHWHQIAYDIGREALAWWYNAGKLALWSLLDRAGVPESRRGEIVQ